MKDLTLREGFPRCLQLLYQCLLFERGKKKSPTFTNQTLLGINYSWGLSVGKLLKNQGNKSLCFSLLSLVEPCFQCSEGISRLVSSSRQPFLTHPRYLVLSSLPLLTLRPDLTKGLWGEGLQWMKSESCGWSLATPILLTQQLLFLALVGYLWVGGHRNWFVLWCRETCWQKFCLKEQIEKHCF